MGNKIVILCGESGCGKDTIAREIESLGYEFLVSTTSRPMRKGESELNPYKFISREDFIELINNDEMLEYRKYETKVDGIDDIWFYGLPKSSIQNNKCYIGVLDIKGLNDLKDIFGDRVVSFYLSVEEGERRSRAKKRGGYNKQEFDRRLLDDNKVFSFKNIHNNIDYVVKNINLSECVGDICGNIQKAVPSDMEI